MKKLHPDYGLTEEFRKKVLETAGIIGVRAAALMHRVSITSVYNWRKWYGAE